MAELMEETMISFNASTQKEMILDTIESELHGLLVDKLDEAEHKAWDSMARYKFQMFGYWASIWVHLNRIGRFDRPNPWKEFVDSARAGDALRAIRPHEEHPTRPIRRACPPRRPVGDRNRARLLRS